MQHLHGSAIPAQSLRISAGWKLLTCCCCFHMAFFTRLLHKGDKGGSPMLHNAGRATSTAAMPSTVIHIRDVPMLPHRQGGPKTVPTVSAVGGRAKNVTYAVKVYYV
jgi:hypothetical protein